MFLSQLTELSFVRGDSGLSPAPEHLPQFNLVDAL